MTTIPQLAAAVQTIMTTVADQAARETGFVVRQSKLGGAGFVQTLVFGWLGKPMASLGELAQTAAALGIPISPQGLDDRFTPAAAACVRHVLETAVTAAITADPVAIPVLARFSAVAVHDSSTVTLPPVLATVWRGCGGTTDAGQAAVKVQVRWDLLGGALTPVTLQDGRAADQTAPVQTEPLPVGGLRIADLGYFALDVLQAASDRGEYWLSRLQVQTAIFDAATGARVDVAAVLQRTTPDIVDRAVQLGVTQRVSARLLAVRVPPAIAQQRRRKLKAEAKAKGRTVSAARLALADWTILVTNVPVALLTVAEALVLYRARWQVELLFKLWKRDGHLDESRSQKPWRVLTEFYAKLLALVIQHWVLILGCWAFPNRSLVKAAQTIREQAALLVAALAGQLPLTTALDQIARCLGAGCRLNRRRKHPNTYQLLLELPEVA